MAKVYEVYVYNSRTDTGTETIFRTTDEDLAWQGRNVVQDTLKRNAWVNEAGELATTMWDVIDILEGGSDSEESVLNDV